MKYVYDGTFAGFLSAVYRIYHDGTGQMGSISASRGSGDLFGEETEVATDINHAETVADAFLKSCGTAAFRWLYRAFLCDDDSEEYLFDYVRRGFKWGKSIYTHQGEVWMWEILRRSQMAGNEAEKFKGIVRFSELAEGMLYAPIHPTHHVLLLIVRHFQKRLSCEEWAIHDVGRHVAAYYDGKQVTIVRVESLKTDIAYSQDEEGFRQLWRDYYRHMAIRERNNPTAQRSFLPKKYWAYLTEMSGKT